MGTFLVLAILAVLVGLIIRGMYKDRQLGRSCGSCGGCAGCRMQGQCHSGKQPESKKAVYDIFRSAGRKSRTGK